MDRLFTRQEAQVLTKRGFYEIWLQNQQSTTRERAYEETEKLHRQVDMAGKNMYSDFSSFDRQTWKMKRRLELPTESFTSLL
jgi:hypothetical protein